MSVPVNIEQAASSSPQLVGHAIAALTMEARTKRRLADEYDSAQECGEIARHGGGRKFKVGDPNVEVTAADPGGTPMATGPPGGI